MTAELNHADFASFFAALWGEPAAPFAWQSALAERVLDSSRDPAATSDCLTQSEARYLTRSPDVDTIRSRLAAAKRERGGHGYTRSPREQRSHIRELKAGLAERFPGGKPRRPARPATGRWQGYDRPQQIERDVAIHSVFDPRIVVLAIQGRRVSLPSTLKLTAALRGLLMRECPLQPPPERCGLRLVRPGRGNPWRAQPTEVFIQPEVLKKFATWVPGGTSASHAARSESSRDISMTGRRSSRWAMLPAPMSGAATPG